MLQSSITPAPDTQARLEELFAGRACVRCGAAAARLSGDRFFCLAHFLRRVPREASPPRVFWCSIGNDGR